MVKNPKQFFFNPNDPANSFDVYINKNPEDTIPIKYTTIEDVKNTILKLEKLYKAKKYSHKRIFQVAMILQVRLRILKDKNPKLLNIKKRYKLAKKYYNFIKKRTKCKGLTPEQTFKFRKQLKFIGGMDNEKIDPEYEKLISMYFKKASSPEEKKFYLDLYKKGVMKNIENGEPGSDGAARKSDLEEAIKLLNPYFSEKKGGMYGTRSQIARQTKVNKDETEKIVNDELPYIGSKSELESVALGEDPEYRKTQYDSAVENDVKTLGLPNINFKNTNYGEKEFIRDSVENDIKTVRPGINGPAQLADAHEINDLFS